MPSSLRKYAWAAIAWLLILGGTELALRAFDVRMAGSNYTADPVAGIGLRPGAKSWATNEGLAWSEINSHGFRDAERSLEKPPGAFRIAVLGDSITEARQVSQDAIFTRLMERDVSRCDALDVAAVEVLNFAVPGFGPAHEYLTLEEKVWAFDPDMIVVVFYSGNDIFDAHPALRGEARDESAYFHLRDGKLVLDASFRQTRRYQPWYRAIKDSLSDALNSSVLALTLYETRLRLMSLSVRRSTPPGGGEIDAVPDAIPPDYRKRWFYGPPSHPVFAEAWNVTEALLSAMLAETRAHGVPFLLIGMPSAEQLHPDERLRARMRNDLGLDDLDYPERRLAAWARRNEAAFLDAGPPLRGHAVSEQVYLNGFSNTTLGTGHLNELGHQVASEVFSAKICEVLTNESRTLP